MEGWFVEVNGKCLPEPYVLSAVYVNKMKGGRFNIPWLNELLANGYRIKIVNNFEYEGAVYAHYVLERTNK